MIVIIKTMIVTVTLPITLLLHSVDEDLYLTAKAISNDIVTYYIRHLKVLFSIDGFNA